MVADELTTADGQRSCSLRREWTRIFAVMLALVLLTGVVTIVGMWQLVGQFHAVAHDRDIQTSTITALRLSLVDHEQIGHQILSGESVDRGAFVRQQDDIVSHFEQAVQIFPAGNGTREILNKTRQSWQRGLMDAGLWGDAALRMTGLHLEENPVFGAASDDARGMLDELDGPSLRAMHQGLADGARLERYLIMLLVFMFSLAVGIAWLFRRRMARHLFTPVAAMHDGVLRLRSGELDHHMLIVRNDELGELAAAFNSMTRTLREHHHALTQRATRDALTGLANRATLTERLVAAFADGIEGFGSCGSLLFIDVDDFKDVNDSLGHEAGDMLLVGLVERLLECVGPQDMVGRLGGDEFAIILAGGQGSPSGSQVAERILSALREPVSVGVTLVAVSVSIGVAQRQPQTADAPELLRHADFAMYMAKGGGKGRYQVFDAQMHEAMQLHAATGDADLRHRNWLEQEQVTSGRV